MAKMIGAFDSGSLEETAAGVLDSALSEFIVSTAAATSSLSPTAPRADARRAAGAAAVNLAKDAYGIDSDFSTKLATAIAAGYSAAFFGLPQNSLLVTTDKICGMFTMTANQRRAVHQQAAAILQNYVMSLKKGNAMSGILQSGSFRDGSLGVLMSQPRAVRDGSLGAIMSQSGSFRDGSLGVLMAQPHATRDGVLGAIMSQSGSFRDGSLGLAATSSLDRYINALMGAVNQSMVGRVGAGASIAQRHYMLTAKILLARALGSPRDLSKVSYSYAAYDVLRQCGCVDSKLLARFFLYVKLETAELKLDLSTVANEGRRLRMAEETKQRKMASQALPAVNGLGGGCGCSGGMGADEVAASTPATPFYQKPLVIGGAAVALGVVLYAVTRK